MKAGERAPTPSRRGAVDLVEAVLLEGREGERFDAVVIDEALVQLRDPAVRAKLEGETAPGSAEVVRPPRARRRGRAAPWTFSV